MTYDELETLALNADDASKEQLGALLRRDWAVRVLDAWTDHTGHWYRRNGDWSVTVATRATFSDFPSAAKDVLPTLSAAVRAKLGECP